MINTSVAVEWSSHLIWFHNFSCAAGRTHWPFGGTWRYDFIRARSEAASRLGAKALFIHNEESRERNNKIPPISWKSPLFCPWLFLRCRTSALLPFFFECTPPWYHMGSLWNRFWGGAEAVFIYNEVPKDRKRFTDFVKIATFCSDLSCSCAVTLPRRPSF